VIRESVRKRLLRTSRHLLRVVEQDLEPGEGGQLTITKKVAADLKQAMGDTAYGAKAAKKIDPTGARAAATEARRLAGALGWEQGRREAGAILG